MSKEEQPLNGVGLKARLGAGYTDTAEAERLEGELAGKVAEIEALNGRIAQLEQAVEGAAAEANKNFRAVIERTAVNPVLPPDLTSVGDYAFSGCDNLAITSLPAGVGRIGISAFAGCVNLATISLPAGVMRIASSAFTNCSSLRSVTFAGTPTSLAGYTFGGCSVLTTINVPWAEGAVSGAPWGATKATINYNYTGGDA